MPAAGTASPAVELFVERAMAVNPSFDSGDAATMAAVAEICSRLDGIALAIELAAARMVAMSPQDLRDRLGDRFRLLSGARRGLERHQTLRHALSWSYDLLDDDERTLLTHCSVFAGGFDGAAAAHLVDALDDYAVLDGLESLVRKSLVTVDQASGHARYGMLETIRQFAEEQLATSGAIDAVRDRHATYYADQAIAQWALLGRTPTVPDARMGRYRVREPARRVPVVQRTERPRDRDRDRRPHDDARLRPATLRAGRMGRTTPARRRRRRRAPTPAPLHRGKSLLLHAPP